jgi:hypothetical protein
LLRARFVACFAVLQRVSHQAGVHQRHRLGRRQGHVVVRPALRGFGPGAGPDLIEFAAAGKRVLLPVPQRRFLTGHVGILVLPGGPQPLPARADVLVVQLADQLFVHDPGQAEALGALPGPDPGRFLPDRGHVVGDPADVAGVVLFPGQVRDVVSLGDAQICSHGASPSAYIVRDALVRALGLRTVTRPADTSRPSSSPVGRSAAAVSVACELAHLPQDLGAGDAGHGDGAARCRHRWW